MVRNGIRPSTLGHGPPTPKNKRFPWRGDKIMVAWGALLARGSLDVWFILSNPLLISGILEKKGPESHSLCRRREYVDQFIRRTCLEMPTNNMRDV